MIFAFLLTIMYFCRMAFLTQKDIRGISCFRDDTLLAMKAPFGSTLEVPDPDDVCIKFSLYSTCLGHANGKEAATL
jgi:hypothetical protein